jgi:glutamate--cysteine ligase
MLCLLCHDLPAMPAVQVRSICEEMGIAFLGVGFDPKWRNEDVPRMPKSRWA